MIFKKQKKNSKDIKNEKPDATMQHNTINCV